MTMAMGQLGAVGLGLEESWGVQVAPTSYLEVLRADVRPEVEVQPVETARGNRSVRAVAAGPAMVRGPITGPVSAEAIGLLLYAALGEVESTLLLPASGGQPAVYSHLFQRQAGVELPSLTVEQNLGGLGSRIATGCRVHELTLSVLPGGIVTFEAELVGRDEVTGTPTAPSYATDDFLHHNGLTATWNGAADTTLEAAEVTFHNNLATGVATAGGQGRLGGLPAGTFGVTARLTRLATSGQPQQDLLAGAAAALSLNLAGGAIQGAVCRRLQVDIERARLVQAGVALAPGRLAHQVELRGIVSPATGHECVVELVNTVASYG